MINGDVKGQNINIMNKEQRTKWMNMGKSALKCTRLNEYLNFNQCSKMHA